MDEMVDTLRFVHPTPASQMPPERYVTVITDYTTKERRKNFIIQSSLFVIQHSLYQRNLAIPQNLLFSSIVSMISR